jgi:hypothetical protein
MVALMLLHLRPHGLTQATSARLLPELALRLPSWPLWAVASGSRRRQVRHCLYRL